MTSAIAVFIRFYSGLTTFQRWQNFFVDKAIEGHDFFPFDTSDVMMNRTADEGGVTIEMAAKNRSLEFFDAAIAGEYLAEIVFYEMPVTTSLPVDLSSASVVARFLGEVIAMTTDLTKLKVELGTAMDAVSGDIPGRKITTSLVGRLPSL